MDIQKIANNLVLSTNEIWISKTTRQIAFPEDGHWECNEVEAESFWFEHRNNCLVTVMRNFTPQGAIFDIGAGNGYVSRALAYNGFETVVVEPGVVGASNAKKQGLTVICSSLEDASFLPNSLPAIGLFDVLEHIEDDISFLSQIKSILQADGRLYLTVPAYNWLWSAEDKITGHYRRYRLQKLAKMLVKLGYKIDYATYFFSFLPLPIFFLRTIPSLLGWRQEGSLETTRNEHNAGSGFFRNLLNKYLSIELSIIRAKRLIPIGGSCLIVASKK